MFKEAAAVATGRVMDRVLPPVPAPPPVEMPGWTGQIQLRNSPEGRIASKRAEARRLEAVIEMKRSARLPAGLALGVFSAVGTHRVFG